ncbi:mechanosensitive ion channel family protein (plasmid) [Rhodobacteraceae bacterium M382]|nr:mechanosensitive ion channel family protein [Rhodobacteraceae bacterium M382]
MAANFHKIFRHWAFILLGFIFFCLVAVVTPALATSDQLSERASVKDVSAEDLELFVVPMTVEKLADLAVVWQNHVSNSIEDYVLLNLGIQSASDEQASALREQVADKVAANALREQNYQIVLDAWTRKGGKPEEIAVHKNYLKAVDTAALQASDPRTILSLGWDWLTSREGGLGIVVKVVFFVVALMVLLFVARFVQRLTERGLKKIPSMSRLLRNFVMMVVYWATIAIGLMVALGIAGVNVTPLFAVFGGLSFILGFALQDTLGNLASGLMIMVLKPFDTGDFIEVGGIGGTVDTMTVVSTQIRTFDNQIIVVPNSKIWGDVITNVSAAETRRVDLVFGIAYTDSAAHAIKVLTAIVAADERCLSEPAAEIFVGELGDSSVNIFCRPWVATDDYWGVYWGIMAKAKEQFDAEGISIPFPQRDVHLITTPQEA